MKRLAFTSPHERGIAYQQRLADALMSQSQQGPPREWSGMAVTPTYGLGHGLTQLASGLAGGWMQGRANAQARALDERRRVHNEARIDALTRDPAPQIESVGDAPATEITARRLDPETGRPQLSARGRATVELLRGADPQAVSQMLTQAAIERLMPKASEPYTLSPGQTRFEGGRAVAQLPEKTEASRPQYVGSGGVLLDPETHDEIYRNPVSERSRANEPPSGYRWAAGGNLEPIAGGPADPAVTNTRRGVQPLRKEFRSLQSVKDYETSLPLLVSARSAPDDGYGDLQLIYTAGKILDPGSVVREGELQLALAAGSPLQRILGTTRFSVEQGGRLTPAVRQQLLGMLNERVLAYRQAYDRDYQQYGEYARESSIDPSQIVGSHAANAYRERQPPESGGAPPSTNAKGWRLMIDAAGNRAYVSPDGSQFEEVR